MGKESLISLTIVLLTSLTAVSLYDERDEIQIDIVNEVEQINGIIALDILNPVQLNENDFLYFEREYDNPDIKFLIYRANIDNYKINLLKEVSEKYKFVTALYYSDKDKKTYMGAYGEFPNKDQKEMPSSYFVRFNADMEIEQAVRVECDINNFYEVGDKIYAECNSEHFFRRNENMTKTMHEIDKENFGLKKEKSEYVIYESYEMKNGNDVIIKVKNEDVIKLIANRDAVDVIVEIIDKNEAVLSNDVVKDVYPFDIMFVELPNEDIVFKLQDSKKDQIYLYHKKDDDKYELIHKKGVKIPPSHNFFGVVKNGNNIGVLVSEKNLYEGKNEVWLFDENLEKLIKKYEIKNLIGNTFADRIEIDGDKNKIILHNNSYLKIGEINFIE